ncbi:Signal recognition particle 14 kDa protein [Bienertia sinuspersici]
MPPAQPRNRASSAPTPSSSVKTPLNSDSFLNELTAMFERSTEKGSVWVTLKRSSMKSKVHKNKMNTAGEAIDYRCLIRATDGKKKISTTVGPKEHQRFQASYATILKAHMTSLKKRERKDKRKAADTEKKGEASKKVAASK